MVCDDRSGGPVLDVGWWGWRRGIAVLLNRFEPVDQRVRRGQTLMLTLKKSAGKSEFISDQHDSATDKNVLTVVYVGNN